jgi:hypothetical protein
MRSCVNLQYASIASSNAPHFANVYASDHSFSDFDPCGFKGDFSILRRVRVQVSPKPRPNGFVLRDDIRVRRVDA